MSQKTKQFDQKNEIIDQNRYKDFYQFYKSLDYQIKRELRLKISKICRVSDVTVKDWLTKQSIPVYQSNRVTEAVKHIAVIIEIDPDLINEKDLFPKLIRQIEYYEGQ